jgi:hypothetical protein
MQLFEKVGGLGLETEESKGKVAKQISSII